MKDLMLDIETMSCGSNPVITQIAACYFNRFSGKPIELAVDKDCTHPSFFSMNIDLTDSMQQGFEIDPETLKWWLKREPTFLEDAKPIDEVLRSFKVFLSRATSIWGHVSFDMPKIINLYERCNRKVPWSKRDLRDLRTLYYLADYDRIPSDQREDDSDDVHDGLGDCVYQCKEVGECFHLLTQRVFISEDGCYRDG